jgi:hypothetical protein
MANANDASGRAAERIALNAKLTALASQISSYTGDQNGLKDLQSKAADINDRLNLVGRLVVGKEYDSAFAYSGTGLDVVST